MPNSLSAPSLAVMLSTVSGFATALSSVPVSQTEFKTVYFNMQTADASAKWNMTTGAVVTGLQMRVQFAGGTNGAKAGDIEISKVVVSPTNTDTVAPTLSNISMVSNNSDTSKAKIGDTVTVTFTADEPINPGGDVQVWRCGSAVWCSGANKFGFDQMASYQDR